MKNVKDYIEETAPGCQRITSLAYWLTPEGLNDPITAELLRRSIETATDEEFKEAFDGATKAEAAQYLKKWELCNMPYWGATELAQAITLSVEGRNESLVLRAISLTQGVGELSEVFTPTTGIKWAMARGYLIKNSICKWLGVQPGEYGHPSNLPSIDDNSAATVRAVTDSKPWLIPEPNDPRPDSFQDWYTPARYFARELVKEDSTLLTKPNILTDKIVQSLTKAGIYKRGGKKPFAAITIKNALVKVPLG